MSTAPQLRALRGATTASANTSEAIAEAVAELLDGHRLDLMLVVGGYNSSNTCNLARICSTKLPTFHIASPDRLVSPKRIQHKAVGARDEADATDWLPPGPIAIGLTSGASTPDNLVETVIRRLDLLANGPPS